MCVFVGRHQTPDVYQTDARTDEPRRIAMSTQQPTIIYTLTDEAPLLATRAFLPIIRTFTAPAGINVDTADISVAARILGEFPDYLTPEQRLPNTLACSRNSAPCAMRSNSAPETK